MAFNINAVSKAEAASNDITNFVLDLITTNPKLAEKFKEMRGE